MERLIGFSNGKDEVTDKSTGEEKSEGSSETLSTETASAVPYTGRTPWSDFSILESLTPERLAQALREVRSGECPRDYLELAQDIELKDLHYRSVISTRKDGVCGLSIKVTPGGESEKDKEIADAVQADLVENVNASLRRLIRDMLDALAKGFSVSEILWDTKGTRWKPSAYKWRDPRWFQYDKDTGNTLMLRHELNIELLPLALNKFVIHEPHLISGAQITSGLALPALFIFMLKNYNVTSWAAFIDRYGFPIRLGKYGKKSTPEDIKTLKRAVAAIGSDFGAIIPESAVLEIIEATCTGTTAKVYEDMAVWADKQISKLVLGQTMTTDEGSSLSQSQTHAEVREDIADSDIVQIIDSLNAQLVVPYVKFNFGDQAVYPKIVLYKPDTKNIEQVIDAVSKLGAQGLKVKADEIRTLLGLTNPEDGDEIIGGVVENAMLQEKKAADLNASLLQTELNAVHQNESIENIEDDAEENDYIEISEEIASVLEKAADRAKDFDSFKIELEKLVIDWQPDEIAKLMAIAFFKARAHGDADFGKDAE